MFLRRFLWRSPRSGGENAMSNGDPGFDAYETPMDDELAATMKSVLDEPEMAMRAPGEGAETPFTFLNVCYRVHSGKDECKEVLHSVSASIPVGSLCVVLGPSGAGKSSLFDVLMGMEDGEVHAGYVPHNRRIVYVRQDISLLPFETVSDVMWFYANLTLPRSYSVEKKRGLIEEILADMQLDHVMNTTVGGLDPNFNLLVKGGLSSGEQRRLQICARMLASPEVFILDEPTTGLDTTNALYLVLVLAQMCRQRRATVIASMHQPRREIFQQVDQVMLLAHGRMVYSGVQSEMVEYVSGSFRAIDNNDNPFDYAMEFLSGLTEQQADQASKRNERRNEWMHNVDLESQEQTVDVGSRSTKKQSLVDGGAHMPTRVRVLVQRILRSYARTASPAYIGRKLLVTTSSSIFPSVLCLMVEKDSASDTKSFVNMQMLICLGIVRWSIISSIDALSRRASWYTERWQGLYHGVDLLVASELVEFVLACVMPVYSYMVIWSINGWGYDAPRVLVKALCVVVLAQQALRGYAQVIAYTAPDIQTCTIRLSCAILVFQVFCGSFLTMTNIPSMLEWVPFCNPLFYGFFGLLKAEYTDYDDVQCPEESVTSAHPMVPCLQGDEVLESYGLDDYSLAYVLMCAPLWAASLVIGWSLFLTTDYSSIQVRESKDVGKSRMSFSRMYKSLLQLLGADLDDSEERKGLTGADGNLEYGSEAYSVKNLNSAKEDAFTPVYMDFINIKYEVPEPQGGEPKVVLGYPWNGAGVTFSVRCSSMFAIMGPSGAGKTSLLRILGGWKMPGTVSADSLGDLTPEDMSYVTEDDVLPPLDTVGEVLHFHAQFVLAPDTPREERKGRVGAVARMMGLEGVQNTLVGGYISSGVHLRGVSGGQARRLSIGCALLKDPRILVLDEPTSGLDSKTAMEVMGAIHKLEDSNCTSVCTIHQPQYSIYNMFETVMFLARGLVVYVGPPHLSTQAFQQATQRSINQYENPADFALDCLVGLKRDEVIELLKTIRKVQTSPSTPTSGQTPKAGTPPPKALGPWSDYRELPPRPVVGHATPRHEPTTPFALQSAPADKLPLSKTFPLIYKRLLRDVWRHPSLTQERLLAPMFGSAILACAYLGLDGDELKASEMTDWEGVSFTSCVLLYILAMPTVTQVQRYRNLFLHELNMNIYRPLAVYAALSVVPIIIFATSSSTLVFLVGNTLIGFRSGARYWIYKWINYFVLCVHAETMATLCGIAFKDVQQALMAFVGGFLTVLVPCSGIFIPMSDIRWPIKLFVYVNPFRLAVASDLINTIDDRTIVKDGDAIYDHYDNGSEIIEYIGYDEATGDKGLNSALLLAISIIIFVAGYVVLSRNVEVRGAKYLLTSISLR